MRKYLQMFEMKYFESWFLADMNSIKNIADRKPKKAHAIVLKDS